MSFAITDNDIQKGDEIVLTLDPKFSEQDESDTSDNTTTNETKKSEENVKSFTFTPFDSLGTQTHHTNTSTGYLFNVAVPWSAIHSGKQSVKTGDTLGINIKVSDVDEGEKGSQTLYLSNKNRALPEIKLTY